MISYEKHNGVIAVTEKVKKQRTCEKMLPFSTMMAILFQPKNCSTATIAGLVSVSEGLVRKNRGNLALSESRGDVVL